MRHSPNRLFILPLLGALSVISPFSIDLYLPAFPQMARDLNTSTAQVSLTLSSYFIGMALGQVFYGPLLDRFGRKPPLAIGLLLFILASLGCYFTQDLNSLMILRFVQAVGGCGAGVGAVAMVRDLYPPKDCARVLSTLFLFIGVSPLFAPTVGGLIVAEYGWKMIFLLQVGIVSGILALILSLLPESHKPDPDISLKPSMILREFIIILQNPRFATFAFAGAFSLSGLFAYVAGSPIVFMEGYQLSIPAYGGVFALLTMGFIIGNQINAMMLKYQSSRTLFTAAVIVQTVTGVVFATGSYFGWYDFTVTLGFFFVFLASAGITYPNAAAMALEPFTKNTGSAASLMGFLQLSIGSCIATGISVVTSQDAFPIIVILAITALCSATAFVAGYTKSIPLNAE